MTGVGARRLVRRLPWAGDFPRLEAPLARMIEGGARLGYAARGAVYLSVGAVALLAALGLTPHATGVVEAMEAWGAWPPGVVLLWITGLGLYAFAGWRVLQAVFDADRLGRSPGALAARAGKAFSAVVHVALAISVFGLLDALEDLRELDDQAKAQAAVRQALSWPAGDILVMVLAGVVVAAGVGNMVRAVGSHFTEDLDCDAAASRWTGIVARIGYAARGIAMALAGAVTALAGWHANSAEARGLGGALEMLKAQPFGPALLALTALGLIAFGAFGFLKAGLRRIGC